MLHLYNVHLLLSRKHAHLLLVVGQMGPCFVHMHRVKTGLERVGIETDLIEDEEVIPIIFLWSRERLGARC